MTYDEWLAEAIRTPRKGHLRAGQHLHILLDMHRPDLLRQINAVQGEHRFRFRNMHRHIDPYPSDLNIPRFLGWVREHW